MLRETYLCLFNCFPSFFAPSPANNFSRIPAHGIQWMVQHFFLSSAVPIHCRFGLPMFEHWFFCCCCYISNTNGIRVIELYVFVTWSIGNLLIMFRYKLIALYFQWNLFASYTNGTCSFVLVKIFPQLFQHQRCIANEVITNIKNLSVQYVEMVARVKS